MPAEPLLAYVGTYTYPGKSEGMYVYRLDTSSGDLTLVHTVPNVVDPAFLALASDRRHLYAVNWMKEYEGKPGGAVSAFAVDPETGNFTFLNRQPAGGADPCHLCVDPSGRYVLVANHESGTVAVLPIQSDGRLGPPSDVRQHTGSGPRPSQAGPHAHFVSFDPTGEYALACDKGTDKVMIYRLDGESGRLVAHDPPFAALHPGAGPRHFVFHPERAFVFVNNEQDSTVSAFAFDRGRGVLSHIQTLPTVPEGSTERNTSSEIGITPSGDFLYVSNRGHDSIAAYAVDSQSGRMRSVGHEPSGGRTPRFFAIDPSGSFLFALNQNSDTIVTFRIDRATGALRSTGQVTQAPTPVCMIFDRA